MKFRKSQRLKSGAVIRQVFINGKSIKAYPILLLKYLEKSQDTQGDSKVAVTVSKRKFKKAVDRNRIKRMLRLAYATYQDVICVEEGKSYYIVLSYVDNQIVTQEQLNLIVQTSLSKLK